MGIYSFDPRRIETCHLLLEPVNIDSNLVLSAWKINRKKKPVGFVMGRRMEDGCCFISCRMQERGEVFQEEILRAVADYLSFFEKCERLILMADQEDGALIEVAARVGLEGLDTWQLWRDDEHQRLYRRMEADFSGRFMPRISQAFGDVAVIRGEVIDLYCTAVMEAAQQTHHVPAYCFEITPHDGVTAIGRIDLRIGFNENIYYSGHIGYGLQEAYRGRGWAAEACRMLVPLIRRHGMDQVIITCRKDNWPSRRTCENIGAKLVRYIFLPPDSELYKQGAREECIFHWSV